MTMMCDFCGTRMDEFYSPLGSSATVCVCSKCGLVGTCGRVKSPLVESSASHGAGFGNIRYGKGLVAQDDFDNIDFSNVETVFDVGSNRGAFLELVYNADPSVKLVGCEPDESILVCVDYATVFIGRFENLFFPGYVNYFDLIYCSHTLEHLDDPGGAIEKMHEMLAPDGLLYLRVPNIQDLDDPAIMEEWFIDKHVWHFSILTLEQYFVRHGFSFETWVVGPDIVVKATKRSANPIRRLINQYAETLKSNLVKLTEVAQWINSKDNIVAWGGGRIYSALLEAGMSEDVPVIDSYLSKEFGCVRPSEYLKSTDSKIIVILSREYEEEITGEIRIKYPDCIPVGIRGLLQESTENLTQIDLSGWVGPSGRVS